MCVCIADGHQAQNDVEFGVSAMRCAHIIIFYRKCLQPTHRTSDDDCIYRMVRRSFDYRVRVRGASKESQVAITIAIRSGANCERVLYVCTPRVRHSRKWSQLTENTYTYNCSCAPETASQMWPPRSILIETQFVIKRRLVIYDDSDGVKLKFFSDSIFMAVNRFGLCDGKTVMLCLIGSCQASGRAAVCSQLPWLSNRLYYSNLKCVL